MGLGWCSQICIENTFVHTLCLFELAFWPSKRTSRALTKVVYSKYALGLGTYTVYHPRFARAINSYQSPLATLGWIDMELCTAPQCTAPYMHAQPSA